MKTAPAGPLALGIALVTAALLGYSGYVHLDIASNYAGNPSGVIHQERLFQVQGVLVIVAGIGILASAALLPARWAQLIWAGAALAMLLSVLAVVYARYAHTGYLGLPDMYEPSWDVPGKVSSAVAEGAAAVLALAGAVVTRLSLRGPTRAAA